MKKLIILSLLALPLSGCMTGNAKRFFAENKNYTFIKPTVVLATPWGTETISAERIESTVAYPYGAKNPTAVIAQQGTHVVQPKAAIVPANPNPTTKSSLSK